MHDPRRLPDWFLSKTIRELHRVIQDGANCALFDSTFIDCWSWLNGYKNRYGLVELDPKVKRTPQNPAIGLKNC